MKKRVELSIADSKEAFVLLRRSGAKAAAKRFAISEGTAYGLKHKLARAGIDVAALEREAKNGKTRISSRSRARRMSTTERDEVVAYAEKHSASTTARKFRISENTVHRWVKEKRIGVPYGSTGYSGSDKRPSADDEAEEAEETWSPGRLEPVVIPGFMTPTSQTKVTAPLDEDQVACMKLCLQALAELPVGLRDAVVDALTHIRQSGVIAWLPEATDK